MGSETVIAKELIISYMVGDSLKPNTFEITKPMLKAFRSAHLYNNTRKLYEREKQALHMPDDIKKLKIQVKHKEKTVKMMGDEFVLCVRLAGEKERKRIEKEVR